MAVIRAVADDVGVRYAPDGSTVEISVDVAAYEGAGGDRPRHRHPARRVGGGLPELLAHGGGLTLVSPGPADAGCAFRLTLRR